MPTSFYNLSLFALIANYDIRSLKNKYKKQKIIWWVGFNKHKDLNNHYKKLLLLFSPFTTIGISQKQTCLT
jgi:hypothetical protein